MGEAAAGLESRIVGLKHGGYRSLRRSTLSRTEGLAPIGN